ncbi:conserved Plasmodium protein, unknown function [Plasmodium ovale curtisi]|uniref:AB hydrolase-1 domain-containing protein n=1 Tax=Plasmodium ovale curtisi TaxID=864141 RepID=A0A1A8X0Q7_PLAOA|nr:conserved Plasmodium protein, unknown function [Plasmodium ovale curtisi]
MFNSSKISHEYIACCKGSTFVVYSQNLPTKERTWSNGSTTALNKWEPPYKDDAEANIVVLLLHGLNGGTYQFEKLFNTLVSFNYKFISLDFYGHGNSNLFKNLNKFTEKLYTEQIYDVLKKKNILHANFVIVGFSMGCIIATHLSRDNIIKIKKFCLISAAGIAKPRHRFLVFLLKCNIRLCLWIAKRYSHLLISEDTFQAISVKPLYISYLKNQNEYYDFEKNMEDFTKRYAILKENQNKFIETFLKVLTGIKLQDSKKYYSALLKTDADVLFIYGREDKLTPFSYTLKFLEKKEDCFQNVKMIILPECCHLVIHEKFSELIQHVVYFLQ